MKYYDSILIIGLILVVQMLLTVNTNNVLTVSNKRTLLSIYIMVGLAAFCEWFSYYLNGTIEETTIYLHKIVVVSKLLIMSVFPVVYANMLLDNLKDENGIKRNKKIMYIFLGSHVLFEIISAKYGLVFYIDESGFRQYGKLYLVYILICVISICYFFKSLFEFNKYFQNKNIVTLLGVLILGTTGAIIQYVNPELKVKWMAIITASIQVYMCYNETAMYVDNLTELLNKGAYQKKVQNIKKAVILMIFDVDSFKNINTEYGHQFGDKVLRIIGRYIKDTYGPYGTCYRYGGDEFFVILDPKYDCKSLNEKFVSKLEEIRETDPRIPYVSIGSTRFDPKTQDILDAVEIADKDMYFWKEKAKKKREKV